MLLPFLLVLIWIWITCFAISFQYLKALFGQLNFAWNVENQACCLALCLAGPAALICALAVDFSRPIA